jgi:hypothetical protein
LARNTIRGLTGIVERCCVSFVRYETKGRPRSGDSKCEGNIKDDGSLEERCRQPRYPAPCAVGPEALRRRLSTVLPLAEAPWSGGFLSNVAELNVPIMFLQLSVEADIARQDFGTDVTCGIHITPPELPRQRHDPHEHVTK